MKRSIEILCLIVAAASMPAAALAQSAQQHVDAAAATAQNALASTGLPLWAWIVIAAVIAIALIAALARRRRPKQAIIKTRLG